MTPSKSYYMLVICLLVLPSFAYSLTEYDFTNLCKNGYRREISLTSPIISASGSTGILKTRSFDNYANCTIVLKPYLTNKDWILLSFRILDLRSFAQDKLTVTDASGKTTITKFIYDDDDETESITSFGTMTITFTAGYWQYTGGYTGFELLFTVFRTGSNCDTSLLFNCDNGRCIADDLKCDGHNHCGDGSDTYACNVSGGAIILVGYVIGGTILVIALSLCIIHIVRRKRSVTQGRVTTLHQPPIRNTGPAHQTVQSNPGYQQTPGTHQYPTGILPYSAPPPTYQECQAPAVNQTFKY